MAERIMYVHLKAGCEIGRGLAWIARVRLSKTWRTAYFRDSALCRVTGHALANHEANFFDSVTGDEYWIPGPKRDRTDGRYSNGQPSIDTDALDDYLAFLAGNPCLAGRRLSTFPPSQRGFLRCSTDPPRLSDTGSMGIWARVEGDSRPRRHPSTMYAPFPTLTVADVGSTAGAGEVVSAGVDVPAHGPVAGVVVAT
ncbi:hypothetical protein [Arthrobacter wenxiniae]|uniref:hypothetical protein n=1 Tax=Arthrobacter wenxiniae TaxID=2713570 RepID=UPI00159E19E5|nr:hypothetical protein [Arthrobacter wenxiniae]